MMRAVAVIVSAVIVLCGGCTSVAAETLILNANDADGETSVSPLAAGVLYEITVSGRYQMSFSGVLGDAEWMADPDFPENPWDERECCNPVEGYQDVWIDNEEYHWMGTEDGVNFKVHTWSQIPPYEYRTYIYGKDSTITFTLNDTDYGDNSGSLTVTIDPVVQSAPTVSTWGLLAMGLLVLAAGTLVLRQRRLTKA